MTVELFNIESETALLNLVLKYPERVYEVSSVRSFMFSSTAHINIYEMVENIMGSGSVPDFHLLKSALQSSGKLEKIGGVDYLNYLAGLTFDISNMREYERQVITAYKARKLIELSSSVSGQIKSPDDVDTAITNIRNQLDHLTFTSGGCSTFSLGDALKQSWDEIVLRVQNPGLRGHTTGFRDIDQVTTGMGEGDLWIFGGRPGSGKTALMCNLVLKSAKAGISSVIFSLEMNRQSLIERMLAIETGIPLTPNIRMGQLTQKELDQISDAIRRFKDLPIHIDTNFATNIYYIESTIRKFKLQKGIHVAYLDYIQLLAERDENSTQELGRISRMLKLLSNELGITSVVFSQLNRGVESRDDKRPTMSDLRQSGNLEEDADLMVGLYRDEYYNPSTTHKGMLEFIIRKHRNGPIGTIPLRFQAETNAITDG